MNYKTDQLFIISTKEKLHILNIHMCSGINVFVVFVIFFLLS
jgi:hypothetical protein